MFLYPIGVPMLRSVLFVGAWLGVFGHSPEDDGVSTEGVKQTPMAVSVQRAFPKIQVERPVTITHFGDGSNRLVVAGQLGPIYFFPNRDDAQEAELFLDLTERVAYNDNQNEEGLLGLAFHPRFHENRSFYVYYTSTKEPQLSVISRFKTKSDDPNQGDPDSEQVLMTIKQPYWNHNGGTLIFGPDGYLYIGLGDGGLRADPLKAGQDLTTWLGKILRIDVDGKDPGLAYAVPKDNPFVATPKAKPEIYALGLRNVWRMAFDRETDDFWVADVGQDLWEEINVVKKGGNYGWSLREGAHPFHQKANDDVASCIDPIWEYPHTDAWGKSITGGCVYRGRNLPELRGYYLYADYVSGKLWALLRDRDSGKVLENRSIAWPPSLPIVTFGEDEQGEVFFSTVTSGGRIYRFVQDAQ